MKKDSNIDSRPTLLISEQVHQGPSLSDALNNSKVRSSKPIGSRDDNLLQLEPDNVRQVYSLQG